jgi:peptidoglycan/xylan/chitin deacetylase (PgdA/CDA1 family)
MLPRRLYLTCHGLGTPPAGLSEASRRFWLPLDVFERCLTLAATVERQTGIDIRFTFDDGNDSDFTLAMPRLLERGRSGMFFVCAGRLDKPGYLASDQVRALAQAGMTIGSHGFDHLNWPSASDAQLRHELHDGKRAIETVIGMPINVASAPFGGLNQRVVRAAAAAGFKCLYASSGGFATAATGLIPRNTLRAGFDPESELPRMVARSYRAWAALYDTARRIKYGFY